MVLNEIENTDAIYNFCETNFPIEQNAFNYYDRLFPNNPFIKVEKWIEARDIIKNFDDKQIKENQEKCIKWWNDYKYYIQKIFKDKIQQ